MTKVTILGLPQSESLKKKIQFKFKLTTEREVCEVDESDTLHDCKEIILIAPKYDNEYDLLFAVFYDGGNTLYLGHFNDGVV